MRWRNTSVVVIAIFSTIYLSIAIESPILNECRVYFRFADWCFLLERNLYFLFYPATTSKYLT